MYEILCFIIRNVFVNKKILCYIYSHLYGGVDVEEDWMEGSWAIEFEDIGASILGL